MALESKNPWVQIWFNPKQTVRSIINTDVQKYFIWLCIVYGIPLAFNAVQNVGVSPLVPLWAIIVGALIFSPFLGLAGIYVCSWLLHLCGKWIGGVGSFKEVRTAVAWSNVPNLISIGVWIVLLSLFGKAIFSAAFMESQLVGYQAGVLFLVMLVEMVSSIWGFVLLLNTLAEVQKFSLWRAFFNIVIPFACVIVLIWVLGSVLYGFSN